ncbi:fungal-specific transcription factor domain-containing protein [Phascolomyces articulosus]|uniref:Fungal-specific transcription factor domain-containing protein n=1 Tax=Phascolomyces articulosus TaxID=60185 RepID=A0AAD5JL61_9FUNG|nr:fungal-specific transcription factor domain-containing protein [Phascolomyces articulosus]
MIYTASNCVISLPLPHLYLSFSSYVPPHITSRYTIVFIQNSLTDQQIPLTLYYILFRCDVNTTQPCTTCRQYHWECTFNDTAKKRGPPKGYIESLETRLKKMEQLLQQMQDNKKRKRPDSSSALCIKNILADEDEDEDEDEEEQEQMNPKTRAEKPPSPSLSPLQPPPRSSSIASTASATTTIVSESLIDSLVQKYFDVCKLTMPIIDKNEFFTAYNNKDQNENISQSLVYAMCAYTTYRLPSDDPIFNTNSQETTPNPSRDATFRYFMDKAVDVVKDEYFVSKIATVQALTLICAQPVLATSQNRNWVFSGLAVRMAQEFRLHRLATNLPKTQGGGDEQKHHLCDLYKRLWCAVYIIDRWNAAAMGRPLAIADSDCDIVLSTTNTNCDLIACSETRQELFIFDQFTQLSSILGEVLRTVYSPQAKHYFQSSSTMTETAESLVQRIQTQLTQWYNDLFTLSDKKENSKITVSEEKTWSLKVCYYGVTLMLYRPFIDTRYHQIRASEKCSDIARKMTDFVKGLNKLDLVRFGFIFTGYSIYQALLIHLYDMTSDDREIAACGHEYLGKTMDECMVPLCEELSDGSEMKLLVISTMDLLKAESVRQQQQSTTTTSEQDPSDYKWTRILRSAGPPLNDLGYSGEINCTVWNYPQSMLIQK